MVDSDSRNTAHGSLPCQPWTREISSLFNLPLSTQRALLPYPGRRCLETVGETERRSTVAAPAASNLGPVCLGDRRLKQ